MNNVTENLAFSLNATVPIFLLMVLGTFFRKVGLLDDHTIKKLNGFVFKALLPALLFKDLASSDFGQIWDWKFAAFCFIATALCITIAFLFSLLKKDRSERGEIIQSSYRSSAAVLGMAFVNNIYGSSTMVAPMIIATVPLYNIAAVTILSLTSPENGEKHEPKKLAVKTLKEIATNPIILGIVVGLLWAAFKIPQPVILSKTVSYLANTATPLSLISLGASFKLQDAKGKLGTCLGISSLKLIVFCALFLPVAVMLGFRDEKIIAILVMLGSATTSSSFIMAKNFGHKGVITACTIMMTTLLSAFTLTMWLFILKTMEYI